MSSVLTCSMILELMASRPMAAKWSGAANLLLRRKRWPEMRNEYPECYIEAYYDFTEENTGTGMANFSRAGTVGVQSTGVFWAGDRPPPLMRFKI